MKHRFKTAIELEVTVIAHVSPAVPPRPCSDPDDPAYSDPGDPGERSVERVIATELGTKKQIDITDCLPESLLEDLAEQAYQEVTND